MFLLVASINRPPQDSGVQIDDDLINGTSPAPLQKSSLYTAIIWLGAYLLLGGERQFVVGRGSDLMQHDASPSTMLPAVLPSTMLVQ